LGEFTRILKKIRVNSPNLHHPRSNLPKIAV
jgi:hypothetical protein